MGSLTTRSGWDGRAASYGSAPRAQDVALLSWVAHAAVAGLESPAGTGSPLVLDLGCGPGLLSAEMALRGARVVAVDSSPEMVLLAHDRLDAVASVVQGDALARPVNEAPAAIVARLLLRHLPDPAAALCTWASWLAPGGRLVVAEGPPPVEDPGHSAWSLYRRAMTLKHDRPAFEPIGAGTVASAMLDAGLDRVRVEQRWTAGNSVRAWAMAGACPAAVVEELVRLHREAPEEARAAYQLVEAPDGDVRLRWRHIVVAGRRSRP